MFDPDKVMIFHVNSSTTYIGIPESARAVMKRDYDQLNLMYRDLKLAAEFALEDCVDLIATDAGHALEAALGRELS